MHEDDFLRAFSATPHDDALRSVFADWLEERGDARHELVRVCLSMKQVPVYSDEYWSHKVRRNELRAACPADWLAATGHDGGVYDPVFRDGVPDDWRGRWRVVREFVERWRGIGMPDVGGRTDRVREEEARLGLSLPPSLREFVAFAHDVFRPPDGRGVLRDVYTMERIPDHPALSLMIQCEGDVQWAVRLDDLGHDDPAVHTFAWTPDHDGPDDTHPFVPYPEAAPVPLSAWMLAYAEGYDGAGSAFAATVLDVERLGREMDAAFPIRRQVGECRRYEHPAGLLASVARDPAVWRGGRRYRLWVGVRTGVPWQAVPAFLWEYARRWRTMGGGMFLSQADVESSLRHWGDGPLPPGVMREAVPPMK